MTKALRMMEEEAKIVDAIIYVLDARAPFSCVNPSFCDFLGEKPIVYVINKADIADEEKVRLWQKFFTKKNSIAIIMNSTKTGAAKTIEKAILSLKTKKVDKFSEKGITVNLRAMVIGVPNSGKSTLVNNLCGKKRAITGNKPGVTKGKQWVKIASGLEVLDTPGTLWPSFDDQRIARNLAYINSIKDDIYDKNELALCLLEDLQKINENILTNRYGIEKKSTSIETLDAIATKKNLVIKGGEKDYDRTCGMILDDFRKGRLGKITLEVPRG